MVFIKNLLAAISWYGGFGPLFRIFLEPLELSVAYHAVGEMDPAFRHINISFETFKKQIAYLRACGYTFHYFRDACNGDGGKRAYLYFDDGFKSIRKFVYPYLKIEKIPATLFVTTEYIDRSGEHTYLGWEELKEIQDVFEIGSHSMHHIKLNKFPIEEAVLEMKKSKEIIEKMLGIHIVSFSYPKGRSNSELEQKASSVGYRITTADPRLHKVRADSQDSTALFKWKTLRVW